MAGRGIASGRSGDVGSDAGGDAGRSGRYGSGYGGAVGVECGVDGEPDRAMVIVAIAARWRRWWRGVTDLVIGLSGTLYGNSLDQIIGALGSAWNWVKENWPLLAGILLAPFTGGLSLLIPLLVKHKDAAIIGFFTSIVGFPDGD